MAFSAPSIFIYVAVLTVLHCLLVQTQPVEMYMLPRLHPDMSCRGTVCKLLSCLKDCKKDRELPFSSVSLCLDCPHMLLPQFNQRKDSDTCLIHPALYIFFFSKRLKLSEKMVSPRKLNGEFGFDIFIYCTGTIQCSGLKEI